MYTICSKYVKYGTTRDICTKYSARYMLMLVTLITGCQLLLAQVPNDPDARFPIFSNTRDSQSELQGKTVPALEAELQHRIAAGREAARFQAEKRAKEELKTEYEIRQLARQAEQDAEQRIRRDVAREQAALLREQTAPESHAGVPVNPVKLTPDLEPVTLPSPGAADKTEKVTDEAEYADVLQTQYMAQRDKKAAELLIPFPDKLDLAHESPAGAQVAGNYARIRIGAYDFVFKMIDGAWTIEFVDAVYRYDKTGKRLK